MLKRVALLVATVAVALGSAPVADAARVPFKPAPPAPAAPHRGNAH
jgi:hypothetical protein